MSNLSHVLAMAVVFVGAQAEPAVPKGTSVIDSAIVVANMPDVHMAAKLVLKLNPATAEADANAAIVRSEMRLLAVYGLALIVPGTSDPPGTLREKYGLRILDGTSDYYKTSQDQVLNQNARRYAARYNRVIIAQVQTGYTPPLGFVPDVATAIAVARAVLIPIYGAKAIQAEEPLTAKRQGDIWVVEGTLPCHERARCLGGTAEVHVSAKDGRILYLTHYR